MSDKQILPPPFEPYCQGRYSYFPSVEIEPYPSDFAHTRGHGEQGKGQDSHQHAGPNTMHCSLHDNKDSPSIFNVSSTTHKEQAHERGASAGPGQVPFPRIPECSSIHLRSPSGQTSSPELNVYGKDGRKPSLLSHEVDDEMDDEDGDVSEGELQSQGQTVAERLAARRKMKRFRLTHQQTRFLMSEFAKQPHPDAAHRERLSREIPGLSPRQVQVWFQNRRAKIKRLTVDDRERMIRMRAVPDDFDNVRALHSPYGAVHGITTILPPPNSGTMSSPYGNHGAGPPMLDMRRGTGDSYLPPNGLTPSFGSIEMGQSGLMDVSDMASSTSPFYQDRLATCSSSPTPSDLEYRNHDPYWHSASSSSMDGAAQPSRAVLREGALIHDQNWNPRSAPEAPHTRHDIYQGGFRVLIAEHQFGIPRSQFAPSMPSGFSGIEPRTYLGES
ncbi:hypothetical protein E4U41_003348 [Claviceps citrina]|nr:hypothetical protein E4U41_003348 [Claviceps citrina]